jgi:hypothetical protein
MLRDTEQAPVGSPRPAVTECAAEADTALAELVRQTLTELARHSPSYAKLFADRAGARLAYHVSAGQIEHLSADGRAAMQEVYLGMQAALTVEPGLDTNAFRARLAHAHR